MLSLNYTLFHPVTHSFTLLHILLIFYKFFTLLQILSQLQEVHRKLYQAELRAETLVTAIDEVKVQHDTERDRY